MKRSDTQNAEQGSSHLFVSSTRDGFHQGHESSQTIDLLNLAILIGLNQLRKEEMKLFRHQKRSSILDAALGLTVRRSSAISSVNFGSIAVGINTQGWWMHWILRDLSKWAAVVRQSGIRHACKFVLFVIRARIMRREDQRRESRLGIVVEKNVRLEQLDVGSENKQFGFSYVPSPRRAVLTLLANLQDDLAQFTFVDFGSGEGRVLLVASEFPFREIIGIEFAKELHETAVANIAKAIPDAEVNRVRAIHSDAVDFAIPKCNCVFYFHNPFGQEVFTQVMRNIEQAHLKDGISIYVLYQQVGAEFETNKTNSISFLRHAPFLTERTVHFRSFWDRFLLGSHELFIFQSQVWPA